MNQRISQTLFEKAKTFFPGGVNSPVRAFGSVGGTPVFLRSGKGAVVEDEDGNSFIDFCCSWGPLIHGHACDEVLQALSETMQNGTSFGTPTRLENELAALVINHHPMVEKIRFVSSGTEAVMSAVRLARGFTGRDKILKFEGCYHGHVDSLMVKAGSGLVTFGTSSSAGVPAALANETLVVPLGDTVALQEVFETYGQQIAAAIIEPVPANNGLLLQEKSFLQRLSELTKKNGSLLIFDEVISGFRIGFSGAAGYYGIAPDLFTFGKIIGGGLPVGAYGGKAQIMSCVAPEGNVYQAGTLSGNPLAMAAGIAQLKKCLAQGFYESLEAKTNLLCTGVNNFCREKNIPLSLVSIGSVFWFSACSTEVIRRADNISEKGVSLFNRMYHLMLEKGIYFGPSAYEVGFVSSAHQEDQLHQAVKVITGTAEQAWKTMR
ncbi:MAG: glutamate-1-semialdehyde 2,1-aminomutase [Bacteroidota bacterium]|jgi:glutamate-1-semialdehyde 2,1-aminomutase